MLLLETQQAHLRASSTSAVMVYSVFHVSFFFFMYPIGGHSVVYVTIWLLLDNIGGDSDFCWFWGVCVSITCSYHVQVSDPLAGSPKCQNGWHNIISGADTGWLSRLSWQTQGLLLQ